MALSSMRGGRNTPGKHMVRSRCLVNSGCEPIPGPAGVLNGVSWGDENLRLFFGRLCRRDNLRTRGGRVHVGINSNSLFLAF